MADRISAAEAVLATVRAARTRIGVIAHQHLSYRQALSIELSARRTGGTERELFSLAHDLIDRRVGVWQRARQACLLELDEGGAAAAAEPVSPEPELGEAASAAFEAPAAEAGPDDTAFTDLDAAVLAELAQAEAELAAQAQAEAEREAETADSELAESRESLGEAPSADEVSVENDAAAMAIVDQVDHGVGDADELSLARPRAIDARVLGADEEAQSDEDIVLPVDGGGEEVMALDAVDDDSQGSSTREEAGFTLTLESPAVDDALEDTAGVHVPELTDDIEIGTVGTAASDDAVLDLEEGALEQVDEIDEERLKAFLNEAKEAEREGDLKRAIVAYDDLLSLAPEYVAGYLGRGRARMALGDVTAALSDFQRAEDLTPDSPEPLVEMGNLYFKRQDYERAVEYYDKALEVDASHAIACCRRGICHHYLKNHQQAFQDLQRAYGLDPDIPNIRKYVRMVVKAMERGQR